MPRLAIFNLLFGFAVLALAAAAGAFIATDMTTAYIKDKALLDSWMLMLQRSAHGHTNLFAVVQICFGLSMPYSPLTERIKKLQTLGLICGIVAMGPLMLVRSNMAPSEGYDAISLLIGVCLSASLLTLITHALGLALKLMRKS